MQRYRFKKIDAFATKHSGGNPAGAVYLKKGEHIGEEAMLQIAKEMKGFVSEVGYLTPLEDAAFHLRYYSSEREVAFCGHATVALMYDLIKNDPVLIEHDIITIETKNDTLDVYNRIAEDDAVFIAAPMPRFSSADLSVTDLAAALDISPDQLDSAYPLRIVNAGLETLIVPVKSLDDILMIFPDLEELNAYCRRIGVDIILLFCDNPVDAANAYRTRVFAPTFGYLEDPATGSGNSAFAYYLLDGGEWDGSPLRLEQNALADSPNIIRLDTRKEADGTRVVFGGGAVVRIEGEYLLA